MKNANGMGNIVKLSGKRRNRYAVRISAGTDLKGRQIRKYLSYHPTKKEALIALSQ